MWLLQVLRGLVRVLCNHTSPELKKPRLETKHLLDVESVSNLRLEDKQDGQLFQDIFFEIYMLVEL